jgi:metallophosphoesterase (TIGR00282 family)
VDLKILFIADIIGRPGRWATSQLLPDLRRSLDIDFVVGNVENAAGGFGLTREIAQKIFTYGVDCLTSGNHIWDRKDIYPYLNEESRLLRPANYPPDVPGKGSGVFETKKFEKVGVINIQGRVFIKEIDCPFRRSLEEIEKLKKDTKIVVVDMHAEATSEKIALGWYLDGKVSAIVGTHTHVQTADEIILPHGTAYITDAGMTGPHDSVIGIRKDDALARFLTQIPHRFRLGIDDVKFCAVLIDIDSDTGRAKKIERLKIDVPKEEEGET